jgi:hypothetical protein
MKRLVLLGEGHGEVSALPVLARKILRSKNLTEQFFVDDSVIRTHNASGLLKWDKRNNQIENREWLRCVCYAAKRQNLGGVLAIYDGDAKTFPAGTSTSFCARTAAKSLALAATEAGAGKSFSLAIVFACVEYETWIIASAESLAGKKFKDGRPALETEETFPTGDPESHGKRWLEEKCPGYRPSRDQRALTELLDLDAVRAKKLRSFTRLEHAIDQLAEAVSKGEHISTPA